MSLTDEQVGRLVEAAYQAARRGFDEGGVPIGAALADASLTVVATSPNLGVQTGDRTAHAEVATVRAAGPGVDLATSVLATTLMPCWMCAGMVDHLGIGTVVVADDRSWPDGALDWLATRRAEVIVARDPRCTELLQSWVARGQPSWRPPPPSPPPPT